MMSHRCLRRALVWVLIVGLAIPTPVLAQGACSLFRTWATGDSLTAGDLNSSFTQTGQTNMTFSCLDDYSATAGQMNTTTDPNSAGSASLSTTGQGELERLRHVLKHTMGRTQWWSHYEDVNFGDRMVRSHLAASTGVRSISTGWMGLESASTRFHVISYGLYSQLAHPESAFLLLHMNGTTRFMVGIDGDVHAAGSVSVGNGTLQHPAVAARADQKTGLYFPAGSQVGVNIDRNLIGRWHGAGLILANHAGVYFQHAGASLHINAMSLRTNGIMYGSADSAFRIQGAGGLSETSDALIAVNSSGVGLTSKTISGTGITITHTVTSISFSAVGLGLPGSRGQFSSTGSAANADDVFTLRAHSVSLMRATDHAVALVHNPSSVNVTITTSGPAAAGRDRGAGLSASSWVHFYWIWDGTTLSGIASPNTPAAGPNLTGLTYTHWAYAGAVYLDSASDLVPTHIMGSMAYYHSMVRVLSAGTATVETVVDLSTTVPPNSTQWLGTFEIRAAGGVGGLRLRYLSGVDYWRWNNASDNQPAAEVIMPMPNVSQRLYYLFNGTVNGVTISVMGYSLPNGGT